MSFIRPIFLALATTILLGFHAVESAQLTELEKLRQDSRVALALRLARDGERQTIADQVAFCETPAPPFEEKARGELLRRSFAQVGLRNVRTDREGNVLAERPGAAARPHVVLAAHLDTVFPKETDVRVKRDGVIMRGPGIGDNCRGLAVLVAVARAMQGGQVTTAGTVTFVANVGEEGLGDLRGVKELFGVQSGRDAATVSRRAPIDSFVSIDGPGYHVTHVGVGSRRYRVTFSGPGGHSFGDFGTPSAVTALGRAVARIGEIQVPPSPRTTFNVGRIGGGTAVNAVPSEAWFEADLRSADAGALMTLDAQFLNAVDAAVKEENARWGSAGAITVRKALVGSRPSGVTPLGAPIVQTALAAGRALGLTTFASEGSTDANIPMSLGIPGIAIGAGGRGGGAHALTEWFDETDAWKGTQQALLIVIALSAR